MSRIQIYQKEHSVLSSVVPVAFCHGKFAKLSFYVFVNNAKFCGGDLKIGVAAEVGSSGMGGFRRVYRRLFVTIWSKYQQKVQRG